MKKKILSAAIIAVAASSANAELYYATVTGVDIYSAVNFGMDSVFEYNSAGGGDSDGGLAGNQFVTPPPVPGLVQVLVYPECHRKFSRRS